MGAWLSRRVMTAKQARSLVFNFGKCYIKFWNNRVVRVVSQGSRQSMSRMSLALLVMVFLLGAAAPPAHSYVLSAQRLFMDNLRETATRLDDFSDSPPEAGMGWQIYRQTDRVPFLTAEMIRDEHLVKVAAFERSTTTVLPLLSAQMYLTYSRAMLRYMAKSEGEELTRVYRQLPEPGIPLMLKLLFPGYVSKETSLGILRTSGPRTSPGGSSGILGWLFEDQGVFSGQKWSLENFLPRVLSVTALVVVGLLFIEFLRFLVLLGLRSLGQMDRKNS